MTSLKPSIPKGTRDFSPVEMVRRNYIFSTIRSVFERFGYQPLETPAMENISTLTGKYGEEGDKLLFRVLNSGDFLQGIEFNQEPADYRKISGSIAEKGLRYDLTVPFARYIVQHQHELVFPFKRYQIQPVWRADRPQKGRYREFYQCDVDVIGSTSLLNETELVMIMDEVFTNLRIPVLIRLNNRKVLAGIAESIGFPEMLTDITVAIDKMDKIGTELVNQELLQRGLTPEAIALLQPVLTMDGKIKDKFTLLQEMFKYSETGRKGLEEMKIVLEHIKPLQLNNKFDFDLRLARGLSYYTGTIFEVKALNASIGSICGGGRYDNLTGIFGLAGMSGVGVSFGADRIYDVLHETRLFPDTIQSSVTVLILNFGNEEEKFGLSLLRDMHHDGISAELYPDQAKIRKQMEYANRKTIPFVVLAGKDEIEKGIITIKNMETGDQQTVTPDQLKSIIQ
jgi:histidyl-tRNA synthetase